MADSLNGIPEILYCVNRKCGADWVIEPNVIDFHDLSYVVSGNGVYCIDGVHMRVSAGDIVYFPPGAMRQAWTAQRDLMELYAVNFLLLGNGARDDVKSLPLPFITHAGIDVKLISLFARLAQVWMEREAFYQMIARGITLQIIGEMGKRSSLVTADRSYDERIERVKKYINENYHQSLSMAALAEQAGLSPVYLGALFQKHERCSVKKYINKIRVNHALEIILTENLSLADIALCCGFSDAFYFSRVFKEQAGIPPSLVRRRGSLDQSSD